ncbi:MAG TPA: Uma2 family endonuclease [Bryobacteraceae bacterium]|jgi:Uma2 family endonuclease
MATSTQVSVEEYLGTSHKPACEYIDGVLIQKPMPTLDHSFIQSRIIALIAAFFRAYVALPELTVRLREKEWLVPDVAITRRDRLERPYPTKPVHVCIEILSPEDRFSKVISKLEDYFAWGVPFCWIIDPAKQRASTVEPDGKPK